ncbi:MAG: hypothetical protein JST04_13760 [Bdellovibrionales bacterium]|nr:hypothetical protein [Bdellovibrionales bacterium]
MISISEIRDAVYPFTFPKAVQLSVVLISLLSASACGQGGVYSTAIPQQELPPIGTPSADGVVVKSRAIVSVTPTAGGSAAKFATSGSQAINVTNAASVSMTLSNQDWRVPTITNDVLDFGFLTVTDVKDNNLNVCGTNGNQHCGKAILRIYTTGKPGAGIWNSTDGYGMPIAAGLSGSTLGSVGLDAAGAYTLESVTLPNSKHTVKYSDFSPTPKFNVKSDFTEAGAGSYAATLVIEYALAP